MRNDANDHADGARSHRCGGPRTTAPSAARSRGRHEVFLAQGFDAASMGEIARAAGVSKGTLYVYFERQGKAVRGHRAGSSARCRPSGCSTSIRRSRRRRVLTRLGIAFAVHVPARGHPAAPHRDRDCRAHAGIGAQVLRDRPGDGIHQARRLPEAQVAAGVLAIEDCEVAAAQFIDACQRRCSSRCCSTSARRRRAADRVCGADRGRSLPGGLPRALSLPGLAFRFRHTFSAHVRPAGRAGARVAAARSIWTDGLE